MFKKLFFICCVVVLLTACPHKELVTITIINQSDEDIFWLRSAKVTSEWYEIPSIDSWSERPDGKYVILRGNTSQDFLNSDGIHINLRNDGWFKYTLFNYDSIRTISWQRICDERIILKEVRFDSWEDFERCNFIITYP